MSAFRAVVLPGDGVVARFPGLVCVARCPDPAQLARLLDVCASVAGDEPGRVLARRLAMWLAGVDAPADLMFGTIAAAGPSRAVFLSGDVEARLGDLRLCGTDSAAWLDRLVPAGTGEARLTLPGVGDGPPPALLDLREGVVAGAGMELLAERAGIALAKPAPAKPAVSRPAVSEPAVSEPAVPERPVPVPAVPEPAAAESGRSINAVPTLVGVEPVRSADPPGPEPVLASTQRTPVSFEDDDADEVPSPLRAPQRSEAILGVAPVEPARAPLEAGDPVGTGARSVRSGAPAGPKVGEARGHLCSRGHLNDPRSHFCVLCGIRMNERTGVLVIGERPPLGLLVFDDGATYTVDAEYIVGRMPESDERVRSGELRAIVVEDRSGAVSRVHAEVRVDGWDVVLVDSGSRNGTHVAAPDEPAWTALPPRHTHRLVPGTRVRLGARTFIFESPSGVR